MIEFLVIREANAAHFADQMESLLNDGFVAVHYGYAVDRGVETGEWLIAYVIRTIDPLEALNKLTDQDTEELSVFDIPIEFTRPDIFQIQKDDGTDIVPFGGFKC